MNRGLSGIGDRSFDVVGDLVVVNVCDPGIGAVPSPNVGPMQALSFAAKMLDAELWLVEQGWDPALANCVLDRSGLARDEISYLQQQHFAAFESASVRACLEASDG